MRRVSYLESIHLGSLNFKEIPICLCVVPFVTQWSGIQKDQKGSSLFITLTSFIWISVPHEPQHRAWAMSQSFDQIYFEARSEIWRFCSLIIPSNGAIRRCWCLWVLSSDESKKCDPCSIALSCQCSLHVHHFSYPRMHVLNTSEENYLSISVLYMSWSCFWVWAHYPHIQASRFFFSTQIKTHIPKDSERYSMWINYDTVLIILDLDTVSKWKHKHVLLKDLKATTSSLENPFEEVSATAPSHGVNMTFLGLR